MGAWFGSFLERCSTPRQKTMQPLKGSLTKSIWMAYSNFKKYINELLKEIKRVYRAVSRKKNVYTSFSLPVWQFGSASDEFPGTKREFHEITNEKQLQNESFFILCYFSLASSKRIGIYDGVQSAGHCTPLIHFTSSELEIGTLSSIKHQACQSKSTLSLRSSSPCAVAVVTSGLGVVLLSKHAACKDEQCCEKDECINEPDYEQLCTQCSV